MNMNLTNIEDNTINKFFDRLRMVDREADKIILSIKYLGVPISVKYNDTGINSITIRRHFDKDWDNPIILNSFNPSEFLNIELTREELLQHYENIISSKSVLVKDDKIIVKKKRKTLSDIDLNVIYES
jgi:hypothetical protein